MLAPAPVAWRQAPGLRPLARERPTGRTNRAATLLADDDVGDAPAPSRDRSCTSCLTGSWRTSPRVRRVGSRARRDGCLVAIRLPRLHPLDLAGRRGRILVVAQPFPARLEFSRGGSVVSRFGRG